MNKEQYIEGIKLLSPIQIDFLKTIYYTKNHCAQPKEVAALRGYKSYHAVNAVIGTIGKKFKKIPGVEVGTYIHTNEEKPEYYALIGEWEPEHGWWRMQDDLVRVLEELRIVSEDPVDVLVTEIMDFEEELKEGRVVTVMVDRYERNTIARQKCIEYYGGVDCQVCGFNFEQVYGANAKGFINVHHIKPLSEVGKEYKVDPIKDLVPLCSNCHSAAHLTRPPTEISELKKLFKK